MRTSRALDNPAVFIACSLRPLSSRDVCCMSMDTSVPPTATLVNIGLPRPVDNRNIHSWNTRQSALCVSCGETVLSRARSTPKESVAYRWLMLFFNLALFEQPFACVLPPPRALSSLVYSFQSVEGGKPTRVVPAPRW